MLEWIITSLILIVIIIALRFILRGRISPCIIYALWALVLVRLLIPVSFGKTDVSVLNAVPDGIRLNEAASAVPTGESGRTQQTALRPAADAHSSAMNDPKASEAPATPIQTTPAVQTQETTAAPTEKPTAPAESFVPMESAAPQTATTAPAAAAAADEDGPSGTPKKSTSIIRILNIIGLAGAAATAAVLFAANLRLALKLRRSRRAYKVEGCCLPAYITEAIETPCLFGIFRPAIYLTPEAVKNEKTLSHIIAHESAHRRHGDNIFALLRCVCLVLHWYNPLVWIAALLSSRDSELACDEAAIKTLGEGERAEYGRTLIELTDTNKTGMLTSAVMLNGGSSARGIKERITMITKKPKTKWFVLAGVLILAAIAVLITFTGKKAAKNGENDANKNAQTVESPTPEATATPEFTAAPTPAPESSAESTPAPEITPEPTEAPDPTPEPTPEPPSAEDQQRMIDDAWTRVEKANELYGYAFEKSSASLANWSNWKSVIIRFTSPKGDQFSCIFDNWESDSGEWTYSYGALFPGEESCQEEENIVHAGHSSRKAIWDLYDEENGGLNYTVLTREELEQAGVELNGTNEDYIRIAEYCGGLFTAKYVNCSEDNIYRCYEAACTGATIYAMPFLPGLDNNASDVICSVGYVFRPIYPSIFSGYYGDIGADIVGGDRPEYFGWMTFGGQVCIRKTADGNYKFGFGFISDGGSSPAYMYPTWYPYEYLAGAMEQWQSGDYDESTVASWIMRELYCMDWEAFKTEFGEEGCAQLLDGIRRWCISEAGFNQQLRDMQVIRAALNADGEFRREMAEVMKLQYANDPEDFEICIGMLNAEEQTLIRTLLTE